MPFIGCSKQVVNQEGNRYNPSNGEKGMLLLQRAIMEDADAYFLDEPELGMGNSHFVGENFAGGGDLQRVAEDGGITQLSDERGCEFLKGVT